MAAERPNQTAVDYVTIALSPALVMGLVTSLVYFLLEVFYRADGPWKVRLQWILFFYVFGAVLTARISLMGEIASRAGLYGSVLALLTYIGLQSFVDYPPGIKELSFLINLFLVGIVWWCSHRITRDCTNIDEETDMSGEGLLQAAGLEEKPQEKDEPNENKKERAGLSGWWQRYQEYRARRTRKRTLGVWVVYFSLAALPIFGLGQSLIPLTAPERRRFAFWLMLVYVACGLGLLLTTCFLGLRRYLRQRRLQMPAAMTGAWLATGGTLLLALLVAGALLPRPYSEYPLLDFLDPSGSKKRAANRVALKGDSPGEGQGQPGQGKADGKEKGGQGKEKGRGEGRDRAEKGNGKGEKGSGGSGKDRDGRSEGGKDSKEKGNPEKGGQEKGSKGEKDGKGDRDRKGGRQGDPQSRQGDQDNRSGEQGQKAGGSQTSAPRLERLHEAVQRVAPVLKWIVFAILALLVVFAFLRGALGFLANFTVWARRLLEAWRNFWANLFGARQEVSVHGGEEVIEAEAEEPAVPFSAFANPFHTGAADSMSPADLVRYTFRAAEAWARERDVSRRDDETAQEFLDRLGEELPALDADARRLAELHARVEYGPGGLPAGAVEAIRAFWVKLERVEAAPLSA